MNADYINPFVEAAFHVLSRVLPDITTTRGKLSITRDPITTRGVAALIGVQGSLEGHVIYDMDKKTAMAIAGAMNGEEFPGVNDMVRSTINEIANMISGNALISLSENGFVCDITPPTFIVGVNSQVYSARNHNHLLVPIETSLGNLDLSVALFPGRQPLTHAIPPRSAS